ncbi:adenosylcobinamide-GDP ribazoletransferase [Bacillus sp. CGMCC 1.16541]|uniref:adenosylcobinamide-GDP ribazoletransferase n=1 Tax=Bacillus sp. CGMCC 1.16541 TaxID=2185143 RepID=UPI000D7327C5|nr:adenosylcobinamide-GDP ribazoletransferase [Bacillus sp. CGMCC 1.16541]
MREVLISLRMAIQFFTIVPAAKTVQWTERRTAHSVFYLPLLGGILGFLLFHLVNMRDEVTISTSVIALLVVLFPIVLTGGLHMDGYMDVSDAYFSRQSKEKKVAILSDPHVGSFAILSFIGLLSLRWMSIHELLVYFDVTLWDMMAIFALPRFLAGWLLMTEKPVKETGLAAYFQRGVTKHTIFFYVCMSLLLLALLLVMVENKFVFVAFSMFVFWFIHFLRTHFGGITGDIIGSSIEGGETFLWLTLWLLHVFVMG